MLYRIECQIDGYASEIVEKSLDLFNTILATIRQSTRAGGHILQNYTMMGKYYINLRIILRDIFSGRTEKRGVFKIVLIDCYFTL